MTNEEMYGVIFESLQNDINDEKITFEFGNILNDIAYEAFIEGTELSDEVSGILDRYLTEATADMEDEESVQESADDDSTDDDVINESVMNIITAYENAEITEDECKLLLESAGVDIDEVFTESTGSAAFNSVIAYDKKLIAVLKQYVNANAKSGAISCPSWIDLMGYKESILKPQEKSKVESDVNELKNSISNSALSTLAAGLHPQRLLDTIPGNAMNKNDFTGVINNLTRVFNDTINTIKPAVAGKAVNAGTDVIRKFDLKKQGIFNKASKSSAKVEQKELSKAEQDAANRKKGNIQRKLINSQRKFGTFS
jgi:hypothetical protein